MPFNSYIPKDLHRTDLHQLIIGTISPRPIALVSTLDKNGSANLAPFSFFNAISSKPPMLVFSVNKPIGSKDQKDTLKNLIESRECVVNLINYRMHRQMSLCSVEYQKGVSEFDKSGLTPLGSDSVKPLRVKESPVHLECTVHDILVLGKHEGASNLIICKIEKMHILSEVLRKDKLRIDSQALDIMGRLGRTEYVRVHGSNIMEVYQSTKPDLISYDGLPLSVKTSTILSANNIAELASCLDLPSRQQVIDYVNTRGFKESSTGFYHKECAALLALNKKEEALCCIMIPEYLNKA